MFSSDRDYTGILLLLRILVIVSIVVLYAASSAAETVRITLLATTDLHGNIYPYDYFTAQPSARGLAKISKLVEAVRARKSNTILIDCGDVIQGAPLETVYQHYLKNGSAPLGIALRGPLTADPMMLAMNAMKYDAIALGNHEFNYGLKNLDKARGDAHFPWLSANTIVVDGSKNRPFDEYAIKQIGEVKVAIIGVTTPSIPMWESAANYKGYKFLPVEETVARVAGEVRAKHHPDLVIVAAHSGLGRDLQTGAPDRNGVAGENAMYDVAAHVKGIDAIVFGHTHNQLASAEIAGVLLMQPKNWGMSLGRMDFTLSKDSGKWVVISKTSRVIPVSADGPVDDEMIRMANPYQDATERYLNVPVSSSKSDLSSAYARVEDTAILDAIQQVQLAEAKADVSFASAFNTQVRIPAGPVSVRQIAALYIYDNTLVALEGNGRMVREALENAARYYLPCPTDCSIGPLIDKKMPGFNYDMAQGVEYEVDVSRAPGDRIRNLRWHGSPLAGEQPLRIAVNNYRAGGSAGYTIFRDAKVLWRSTEEIRDMIIRYYSNGKTLPTEADRNWKVIPIAAARELRREALQENPPSGNR